jgi:hypothetical protein
MLTYAGVCWRTQVEAQKGDMQQLQRQLRASDEALAACQVLTLLALRGTKVQTLTPEEALAACQVLTLLALLVKKYKY